MPVKCAINGFGRIGRLAFRYAWEDPTLEVVHVNDLASCESAAYLAQFDSVHGTWVRDVAAAADGSGFTVDGHHAVSYSREADFTRVDWRALGVELVLECTGKFLTVAELNRYFDVCGVKQVVVSAPVKEDGAVNIVLGCNDQLVPGQRLLTNASCTTNCLAPVVRVIHERFGITKGCITTVHDVTGTQCLVDMPNTKKTDLRRARSGMVNLCPTSTGSATAIVEIYPELKGKLNGLAVRVPLLNASLTDCVFLLERDTTVAEVNAALEEASRAGPLAGVLGYEARPLVSTDYTNDTRSGVVDALSTQVIDGNMVKIYVWYDNEAGYSKRMAELCHIAAAVNITGTEPAFKYNL